MKSRISRQISKEDRIERITSLGNYCFVLGGLFRYDKKPVFIALLEIILSVAQTFGVILLPSLIISMLERKCTVSELVINTILIFAMYGIVCAISNYLKKRNENQYVEYRCLSKIPQMMRKGMVLDYCQYESEEVQRLRAESHDSIWGGNQGIEGLIHAMVAVLTSLLGLVLYTVLIAGINPWIILLLIFISTLQIVGFKMANRYELSHKREKAQLQIHQEYLDRKAYETAAGKDVRLYRLQDWLNYHYKKANQKYRSLIAKEKGCYFANNLLGLVLQLCRDAVCYFYLIELLKKGMPVASFVLYIGTVAGFSAYFSQLTARVTEMERFQKSVGYFRKYLSIKNEMHHGDGIAPDEECFTYRIEFSHVTFRYPGSKSAVLSDISFVMKPGEKIALVGINGAGKTTIVKLLCGFYKPTSGHIFINDTDINDLDMDLYQKQLSAVFQEPFVISNMIAENVSCEAEGEYDTERCIEALRIAGLWEKVSSLPNKERTYLNKDMDENGIALSGGEQQKLMLARALYRACKFLILDEPTAALDAIAENDIYEKYQKLINGKTSLFISHRLASTRFCDRILFLENGQITEQGTHEDLMRQNGKYASMFEIQSKYYREGGEERDEEQIENE